MYKRQLEQGQAARFWDHRPVAADVARLAGHIDPGCAAFFYSPVATVPPWPWYKYQLDAMWAGLAAGIPTVNGYSGNVPPGWALVDPIVRGPEDEARLRAALAAWEASAGIAGEVCWVQVADG